MLTSHRVNVSVYYEDKLYYKSLPLDVPIIEVAQALAELLITDSPRRSGKPTLTRITGEQLTSDLSLRTEGIVDSDILQLTYEKNTIPYQEIVEDISIPIGKLAELRNRKFQIPDARIIAIIWFNITTILLGIAAHIWWYKSGYSTQIWIYSAVLAAISLVTAALVVLFSEYDSNGLRWIAPIIVSDLAIIKFVPAAISYEQAIIFCGFSLCMTLIWAFVYRQYLVAVSSIIVLLGIATLVLIIQDWLHCELKFTWMILLIIAMLYPCIDYYDSVLAGLKMPRILTPDNEAVIPQDEVVSPYTVNFDFFTQENEPVFTFTHRITNINKITVIVAGVILIVSSIGFLWTCSNLAAAIAVCLVAIWFITRFGTASTRFKALYCISIGMLALILELILIAYRQPEIRFFAAIILAILPFFIIILTGLGIVGSTRDIPRITGILFAIHYLLLLAVIPTILLAINAFSLVRNL